MAILDDVVAGARAVPAAGSYIVEPDRRAAIRAAVASAAAGDVLAVAGKGHESGQEQDGIVTPFDDRDVLRAALLDVDQ